jgi:hypothetical protein
MVATIFGGFIGMGPMVGAVKASPYWAVKPQPQVGDCRHGGNHRINYFSRILLNPL